MAAALAAATAGPAAAAPPAVDEYTLDLPGAGGPKHPDGTTDPRPEALPPATREALSAPEDEALVAIATDPALGAPTRVAKPESHRGGDPPPDGDRGGDPTVGGDRGGNLPLGGESRGLMTAAIGAVGNGPMLALLGALGLVALTGAIARRRHSGQAAD